MKIKHLKVYEGSGKNYIPIPKIVLQGKWLDRQGFSIGDQITVTYNEDQITIMKSSDLQDSTCMEPEGSACKE